MRLRFHSRQILFIILYFFVGGFAENSVAQVKVIAPKSVKANQPFKIDFHIPIDEGKIFKIDTTRTTKLKNENDLSFTANSEASLRTNDFKIGNCLMSQKSEYINNQSTSYYNYSYTLVPKIPGDFLIEPWSVRLYYDVYTSDSFWVHVSEEKISSADSLEKVKGLDIYGFEHFMESFFNPDLSDGAHFSTPNTKYEVEVTVPFSINYSLSLVNMDGITTPDNISISMEDYKWPKEINKSVTTNSSSTRKKGYNVYTKTYTLSLKPIRSGTYTIPHLRFATKDEKWLAPEIKVIVK